jgi:hypothetical protein
MFLHMGHRRNPVYQISPHSLAVAFGGVSLVLLPAVFAQQLLRTKKPSRGSAVNPFDRLAIGQDSQLAEWLSNLGTGLGIVTPSWSIGSKPVANGKCLSMMRWSLAKPWL